MANFRKDTIVIGGSAGGFGALKTLLGGLPSDLPAAVFVVLHAGATARANPPLLQPFSALPLRLAVDGGPIEPGTATFAPPGVHLLLGNGHVHLRKGPLENNFRPAIDPLFRSAAVYRSTRTIALVLSGMLDDGAAGLRAIARVGGTALVQRPDTAEFPDMPSAALGLVPEARPVAVDALAKALVGLAGTPAAAPRAAPEDVRIELRIAGLEGATIEAEERLGTLSPYNCPDCNGVLWEIDDGGLVRYRCHTGHAYTLDVLNACQEEALERSLYDTLRAQRERADVLRKLAARASRESERARYAERARAYDEDAAMLERIIKRPSEDDPARP